MHFAQQRLYAIPIRISHPVRMGCHPTVPLYSVLIGSTATDIWTDMLTWYRHAQVLSLDVAAGALASGCLAAWWYAVPMPWAWYLELPLAVWVAYTADHLLDAHRLGSRANTHRHRFHVQYFMPILILWLLADGIGAVIAIWLPVEILLFGLVLIGATMLHFGLVWLIRGRTSLWLTKELAVAVIYSAGVWGGPWTLAGRRISLPDLIPFIQFFLLAIMNLLLFAWFEHDEDEAAGHSSYVRAIGKPVARKLLAGIQGTFLILAIVLPISTSGSEKSLLMELILLAMFGMLSGIYFAPKWFSQHDRYRLFGDLVFLLPLLLWVFD